MEVATILFRFSCFIIVIFMISVWVRKYLKDDDLCLVDYQPIREADETSRPQISICFYDPFVEKKLKEVSTNKTKYLKYLKATISKGSKANFSTVRYNDVTIDLREFYLGTSGVYDDGNQVDLKYPSNIDIITTFNGFYYHEFFKCFSLEIKNNIEKNKIKYFSHKFSLELYKKFFERGTAYSTVHGKNQYMLQENGKFLRSDLNDTSIGVNLLLSVTKLEILKRRNKSKLPCNANWKNWDPYLTLKYAKEIGCKAPYITTIDSFPTCKTQEELEKWVQFVPNVKNETGNIPCQEMPRIDFEVTDTPTIPAENIFFLTITYPQQAKVITQSREVDYHTLIGNIGGYIGMFLGSMIMITNLYGI